MTEIPDRVEHRGKWYRFGGLLVDGGEMRVYYLDEECLEDWSDDAPDVRPWWQRLLGLGA